jgi:uncharacterized protein YoxC
VIKAGATMRKELISFLETVAIMVVILAFFISPVFADTTMSVGVQSDGNVNLDVDVNSTGDVNVTIDGTNIGAEIDGLHTDVGNLNQQVGNLTQNVNTIDNNLNTIFTDVYGSSPSSPDHFLDGAENATTIPMVDYCSDPKLNQYFTTFSSIPPAEFKEYMKSFGYDDEAHINMIWTICQEKRLNSMNSYINDKDNTWSSDTGIYFSDVVNLIRGAVNWLLGINTSPTSDQENVATTLDSYFASDNDISYLLLRTQDLHFRVAALEKTMDEIASEAYCQGKLDVLREYGLEQVSCGNVTYHNHMKNPITGEDMVIGIEPFE